MHQDNGVLGNAYLVGLVAVEHDRELLLDLAMEVVLGVQILVGLVPPHNGKAVLAVGEGFKLTEEEK